MATKNVMVLGIEEGYLEATVYTVDENHFLATLNGMEIDESEPELFDQYEAFVDLNPQETPLPCMVDVIANVWVY